VEARIGEAKPQKEGEKKMKTYQVQYSIKLSVHYTVEAETAEKALDLADSGDYEQVVDEEDWEYEGTFRREDLERAWAEQKKALT